MRPFPFHHKVCYKNTSKLNLSVFWMAAPFSANKNFFAPTPKSRPDTPAEWKGPNPFKFADKERRPFRSGPSDDSDQTFFGFAWGQHFGGKNVEPNWTAAVPPENWITCVPRPSERTNIRGEHTWRSKPVMRSRLWPCVVGAVVTRWIDWDGGKGCLEEFSPKRDCTWNMRLPNAMIEEVANLLEYQTVWSERTQTGSQKTLTKNLGFCYHACAVTSGQIGNGDMGQKLVKYPSAQQWQKFNINPQTWDPGWKQDERHEQHQ